MMGLSMGGVRNFMGYSLICHSKHSSLDFLDNEGNPSSDNSLTDVVSFSTDDTATLGPWLDDIVVLAIAYWVDSLGSFKHNNYRIT